MSARRTAVASIAIVCLSVTIAAFVSPASAAPTEPADVELLGGV